MSHKLGRAEPREKRSGFSVMATRKFLYRAHEPEVWLHSLCSCNAHHLTTTFESNRFSLLSCHLPSEKACRPLRPSNQHSCYSSMNRADVCDRPPRCVVEMECKSACQCSDSRLSLPPPPLCLLLLLSLNQRPSQGTGTHSACPESELRNCGPVRKAIERSKIYPWQPEGGKNHIFSRLAAEWTTCS